MTNQDKILMKHVKGSFLLFSFLCYSYCLFFISLLREIKFIVHVRLQSCKLVQRDVEQQTKKINKRYLKLQPKGGQLILLGAV